MDRPIKVLQVFTILNMGGAETNLMNYYRNLDTKKIRFDFLVHREEGFFETEILQRGSKIYRLPPIHPLRLKQYKKAVDAFFKEHGHEYDIVHGQLSELGVYIYQAAKKYGIPVRIAHAHNSKMDWDLKGPFRLLWKNKMRKYINGYFSCGDESSEFLFGKQLAQKAFVMTNSIDVNQFKFNEVDYQRYRQEFEIRSDYNFFHVGRFATQKNHKFLIDVFAQLVKSIPEARLFLIGEGELKAEIEQKVALLGLQQNIVFLGKRNDVNKWMQACDYFFFPSLFEGFSVAFIEAQASGMHCFISDGIPQESVILPDSVTVLPLKQSPDYWTERILATIADGITQDREAYLKIKQAGYHVQDNVEKLYNEYVSLLQQYKK